MSSKPALRQQYLDFRNNLDTAYRRTASDLIIDRVLTSPLIQAAHTLAVFISTGSEVDTHPLIPTLLSLGKRLAAPVITHHQISLRHLSSLEACLPGSLNILEPPPSEPIVQPNEIDVFLVPGLVFDTFGYRLGYGKGYYDQLLSTARGDKLGLGFTDQLTYALPHDAHDIKLSQLLTDTVGLSFFPFPQKSLS